MARPKQEFTRNVFLMIRMLPAEMEHVKACANAEFLPVSEYVRARLASADMPAPISNQRASSSLPVSSHQKPVNESLPVASTKSNQNLDVSKANDGKSAARASHTIDGEVSRKTGHALGCDCYHCGNYRRLLLPAAKPAKVSPTKHTHRLR